MRPLSLRPHGYLESVELNSFLLPDGCWLHLYDRSGHLRLTEAEAAVRRARLLPEKLRSLGIDPDQL